MSSVVQMTGFAFTLESTHMVCHPMRVGTVGSCIAFEEDSPGAFLLLSRKNTQVMQDPPELINVWVVSAVRL